MVKIMQVLKVKKLHKNAQLPKFGTDGAAGMDFYIPRPETFIPNETRLVPLGIAVEVPKGHMLIVAPRSSTGIKTPLRMTNSIGVIDSDYRGEINAVFENTSNEAYIAHEGDRLVQGILVEVPKVLIQEVEELTETKRGVGGFGSTGA
ncbi:dUTP diphosphatase [Veillonella caviae]|uniref:dUTP diphosphatase n=1 Tax=Veillonella caviae TaxID=248316 RepID=UPI0023F0669D|nr:dUTP diphosphatase [Veillonella caviae]MCI6407769.1 dUTP diphosphatase [Veillonella caviae]MDY6224656.1 dUTP diphosphatase [Veillonella caviae]